MNKDRLNRHYNLDLDSLFSSSQSSQSTKLSGSGSSNLSASAPSGQLSTRQNIPNTRASFDMDHFFSSVLNPSQPSWKSMGPPPPQIPPRTAANQKKASVQIKRVSTPTSDLLDLRQGKWECHTCTELSWLLMHLMSVQLWVSRVLTFTSPWD